MYQQGPKQLFQKDIVKVIVNHPGITERGVRELMGYDSRGYSNSFPKRIREAMDNKLIARVRGKMNDEKKKIYRYYVPSDVANLIKHGGDFFDKTQLHTLKCHIKESRVK